MNKKIALVTGGCSGIGQQISKQLAKHGILVIINYAHNKYNAKLTQKEIIDRGGDAIIIKADVSNPKQVKRMFRKIGKKYGRLDFLINNAGINVMQKLEMFDDDIWLDILKVNLYGKFLCIKYAIPLLKRSSMPRVVNIASRLGTKAMPQSSSYCCAESAILMLTKVSALELSEYNIHVNTVSPGLTRTALSKGVYKDPKIWKKVKECTPVGRIGEPEDIANIVEFLVSDKADYIDGENINVSGGNLLI